MILRMVWLTNIEQMDHGYIKWDLSIIIFGFSIMEYDGYLHENETCLVVKECVEYAVQNFELSQGTIWHDRKVIENRTKIN